MSMFHALINSWGNTRGNAMKAFVKRSTFLLLLLLAQFTFAQEAMPVQVGEQNATAPVNAVEGVGQLKKRTPTLAVLPFRDTNREAKESGYGSSIAAILNTHIRNETNFIVLERSRLQQVLGEKALELHGLTDAERSRLKSMFSVEVILTGEVAQIGGVLHVDARLISVSTGNVVVAKYVEVKEINRLRQQLIGLSRNIELEYLRQWIGSLEIIASPVEGEVYLDGTYIGKSSQEVPLQVNKLLEGEYKLRVIAGGYKEFEQVVQVKPKSVREVSVILNSLPGSLRIESEPIGATVKINGKKMGTTPFNLDGLEKGLYSVGLSLDNHLSWSRNVTVNPGQLSEIKGKLKVIPGKLMVASEPSGAVVYVDRRKAGKTPLLVENIRPGSYQIIIKKPAYESYSGVVSIKPGEEYSLSHTLDRQMGKLTVVADETGSHVKVIQDGLVVLNKPLPIHKIPLPIGEYRIEVSKENYFTVTETKVIKVDKETRLEPTLTMKPGVIRFSQTDNQGEFYVDGTYQGMGGEFALKQGTHSVERRTFFDIQKKDVEVKANQMEQVKFEQPDRKVERWIIPLTVLGAVLGLYAVTEE